MVVKKTIRFPEDIDNSIELDAKKKGLGYNAYLIEAVKHFRDCKKKIKEVIPQLKEIITKFPSECSKCGKEIGMGVRAYWSTGVCVCVGCYVDSMSDKVLFNRAIKKRELDKIIDYAEKLAEEKFQLLDGLNIQEKAGKFYDGLIEFRRMILNYIKQTFVPQEEKELFEKILKQYDENQELADTVNLALQLPMLKKLNALRKKKQIAS